MSKTIREWTLHEEIGRGAIGVIFRATHKYQTGEFAVKQLRPDLASEPGLRERFLQEATTATKLRHPNIVETHPVFEDEDALYLPMELLKGSSLLNCLEEHEGAWPLSIATQYIAQAAA